jgi:glucosamine-6-phosphate deaminase
MKTIIYRDADTAGQAAAVLLASKVVSLEKAVLCLATGGTPLPVYQHLVYLYENKFVDFSNTVTFNLDEYVGLPANDENSFRYFMDANLFSKINIPQDNIHFLDGMARDLEKECAGYETAIAAQGGIDIALVGIGQNGHVGFNECADALEYATHAESLTANTIEVNSGYAGSATPEKALTMGIGSIMQAKEIVFLATGEAKANAVRNMLNGKINPNCPASLLRLHRNATILLDEAAASKL